MFITKTIFYRIESFLANSYKFYRIRRTMFGQVVPMAILQNTLQAVDNVKEVDFAHKVAKTH